MLRVHIKTMSYHDMIRAKVNAKDFLNNKRNVGGFTRQIIGG